MKKICSGFTGPPQNKVISFLIRFLGGLILLTSNNSLIVIFYIWFINH